MRNNLKGYNLESVEKTLSKYGLDLSIRAEQLPLEIFIDIANIIYKHNNSKAIKEEQRSLRWAIRQIKAYIQLSNEQEVCINTFQLRNDVVHDYINNELYKEEIADFFIGNNRIESLKGIIVAIDKYVGAENIK